MPFGFGRKFECGACEAKFSTESELKDHIKVHNLSIKCPRCTIELQFGLKDRTSAPQCQHCGIALDVKFLAQAWVFKGVHGDSGGNYSRPGPHIWSFDRAIETDPQNTLAWLLKGAWLGFGEATGRYAEAIRCYDRVLGIDGGNGDARLLKAACLNAQRRFGDAMLCCYASLETNPQLVEAWYCMGISQFKQGRGEEGLESYKKFTDLARSGDYDKSVQESIQGLFTTHLGITSGDIKHEQEILNLIWTSMCAKVIRRAGELAAVQTR